MQAQTQTTTAAMSTTAELLAAYNAITVYDTQEGKDLARAIIQGDTSGKVPTKKEQIVMDDCAGEYFIPAILATKPGKLAPAQAVAPLASRDTLRPAMNCVYYDSTRAAVVATCGHVLMSFPCGPLAPASGLLHPVTLEPLKAGDVVNKQVMGKDAVDTRYPDYVNVIRLPNPNGPAVTLDVQSFRNQLAGIARAQRFVNLYTGIRARIQHEGQDFYVDAALCDNVLRAMQASGTTRVHLDLSYSSRALQLTDVNDAKKLALIMPVYRPDREADGDGFAYCTVLDTAVGQVLTSPASVKRVTVKKPVQPRAVQVLSKEEKKLLAAHVKQYEAAPERQIEMMGQVRETLATHLAHLRQAAFRQLTSKEIHNPLVSDALFLARVGRAFLATIAPAPPIATPTIADLAAANVAHETAVLDAVAELGDMTWSDAQGFVDFGSFDYMQCLAKGLTPAETAKVLLKDTAQTSPAVTLPPVSDDKQLGHRIAPSEATGSNKNAQTVVFYLDEKREQFPRTAPHRLLRRLLTLLGVTERAHSVHRPRNYALFCIDATNALALRISEEVAQLDTNHGGFTPAHAALIARRELGRNTAPTSPAVPATAPETTFARLYNASAAKAVPVKKAAPRKRIKTVEVPAETAAEMLAQDQTELARLYAWIEQNPNADSLGDVRFLTQQQAKSVERQMANMQAANATVQMGRETPAPAKAGPTINEMEAALTTSGFFVGGLTDSVIEHYYTKLIAPSLTLEADTPAPVLIPSEPNRKRKFPFTALRLAGHRITVLHQIGKCAVARVFPCEGRAPYYAARFRQHTVQFGHLHEAEQALLTLRRMDNAEIRRDNEVFTLTDALDQLDLRPPCLDRFCAHHGLDADRSYKRRELRRAITDKREPKMPVYLSLLNKLTPTNLA